MRRPPRLPLEVQIPLKAVGPLSGAAITAFGAAICAVGSMQLSTVLVLSSGTLAAITVGCLGAAMTYVVGVVGTLATIGVFTVIVLTGTAISLPLVALFGTAALAGIGITYSPIRVTLELTDLTPPRVVRILVTAYLVTITAALVVITAVNSRRLFT